MSVGVWADYPYLQRFGKINFTMKKHQEEIPTTLPLTREEALQFMELVEEERNAEQRARDRKQAIQSMMKRAGVRSLRQMNHLIERALR